MSDNKRKNDKRKQSDKSKKSHKEVKILKDPTKAMIKAKFNLNQVGKRNIEMNQAL